MKPKLIAQIATVMFVMALAATSGLSQTTFFSDTFNNGSTVDSATPVPPTPNSTSYEVITCAATTNNPTPSITPGDFLFGCGSTSSGISEMQALFSTNAITLASNSDYITLVVVFTNQSLNTASRAYLAVGLYNSGASTNYPVPGGMNGTETMVNTTSNVLDNAQLWQGYFGQQTYSGNKNEITARQAQTGVDSTSQELLTTGSGTYSFQHPTGAEIGSAVTVGANATMTSATYTEVFTITLTTPTTLAITNWLYTGTVTNSANLVTNMGGVASGTTFLTSGFNALAMGWYQKVATPLNNAVGIESINIFGQSTLISGPPAITTQPANVIAATNGYVQFTTAAVGADVAYQWELNGVVLANGGNYSGVTGSGASSTLTVSPAVATNGATTLNGYSCLITGALGYTTNTQVASLTLVASTNLAWTGSVGANWDVDTTPNWETTNGVVTVGPVDFTVGDPVNFNDNAALANTFVTLVGNVAPSSIYVTTVDGFNFNGSGSIVGPCSVTYDGENIDNGQEIQANVNNSYTGGTTINDIYVYLANNNGLGNGPVYLNESNTLEIVNTGSATSGVNGDIHVNTNFEFLVDGSGTFASVFFGGFYGSSTATLTLEPASFGTTNRMRFYGTNTVCNANIFIDGPVTPQAQYYGDEIAFYNSSGAQTYNGIISGNGGLIVRGNGIAVLSGQNTFSGGTTPTAGVLGLGSSSQGGTGSSVTSGPLGTGVLLLAPEVPTTTGATGEILASGGAQTVGNTIEYPSGTNNLALEIGGTNNLTLSGPLNLAGADGNNSITSRFIVVTNTGLTTFSGPITDGGLGYSFNVSAGNTNRSTLALSGTDSYHGATTVSNTATLLVNGSLTASSSVTVATNAALGGSGTVSSPVTILSGGTLAAGNQGIGTLTLSGLTFQSGGTNVVDVSGSSGNSKVIVGSATYAGTLAPVVTSGTISAGQTFQIFSASSVSGNFTATNGTPGPGMTWYFNPATGVLTAVGSSVIVPNVPPHITAFSLAGSNVSISGTNGVNGGTYYLLGQTNVALPINQWYPVATNVVTASGGTEAFSFTGTNVFSGPTPALFLILSSTNN
ncbi:MAG TPA: hypothetical protein VGI03_14845 [Verrucomicrobiae bacterium]|jgi:autotransporter-associated beta strand protein